RTRIDAQRQRERGRLGRGSRFGCGNPLRDVRALAAQLVIGVDGHYERVRQRRKQAAEQRHYDEVELPRQSLQLVELGTAERADDDDDDRTKHANDDAVDRLQQTPAPPPATLQLDAEEAAIVHSLRR